VTGYSIPNFICPAGPALTWYAVLATITAVALTVPSSAPAEDPGRIYVYAQRQTAARSWLPISCDGAVVAELKRGTLFAMNVPPGRHTLSTETGVPAFVDVHSGEESFVRLDWSFEVGRSAIPVLNTVRPDQARKEMRFLSYIRANKVHASLVPRTDPREPPPLRLKKRGEQ
jgi:hypothetical protein